MSKLIFHAAAMLIVSVSLVKGQDLSRFYIVPSWGLPCIVDQIEKLSQAESDPVRIFLYNCENQHASISLPSWVSLDLLEAGGTASEGSTLRAAMAVASALSSATSIDFRKMGSEAVISDVSLSGAFSGGYYAVSSEIAESNNMEEAVSEGDLVLELLRRSSSDRWLGLIFFAQADRPTVLDSAIAVRDYQSALTAVEAGEFSDPFVELVLPIVDVTFSDESGAEVLDLRTWAIENGIEDYSPVSFLAPARGQDEIEAEAIYKWARRGLVLNSDGTIRGIKLPTYMDFQAGLPTKVPEMDHPLGVTLIVEFFKADLRCIVDAHTVTERGHVLIPRSPCDD